MKSGAGSASIISGSAAATEAASAVSNGRRGSARRRIVPPTNRPSALETRIAAQAPAPPRSRLATSAPSTGKATPTVFTKDAATMIAHAQVRDRSSANPSRRSTRKR